MAGASETGNGPKAAPSSQATADGLPRIGAAPSGSVEHVLPGTVLPHGATESGATAIGSAVATSPSSSTHDVGFSDWFPWTLTALGIAVSLGWNFFNFKRTTYLQRRLRLETVKLEEFRRVRTPIDKSLEEVRAHRNALRALKKGARALSDLRQEVGLVQQDLVKEYLRLDTALADADASAYASGDNWLAPVEAIWEDLAEAFNPVYEAQKTEEEARASLGTCILLLERMSRCVTDRIDRETARYSEMQDRRRGWWPFAKPSAPIVLKSKP